MTDEEGKADAQPFHLILLATKLLADRNLCRLVTDAHVDGYYYKPRIDRELGLDLHAPMTHPRRA